MMKPKKRRNIQLKTKPASTKYKEKMKKRAAKKRTRTKHDRQKRRKTIQKVKKTKKHQVKTQEIERKRKENQRQLKINLALTAVVTLLIWFVGLSFFFGFVKVSGYGMSPTLRDNEVVIFKKTRETKTLKRFDLVLFKRGDKKQIRRIIGFPGETIVYKNDELLVDGEVVDEKFLVDKVNESQRNGQNYTENFSIYDLLDRESIPEGKYLFLGDNRPYSTDSRHYGLLDESMIIGVVQLKIFPLNEWTVY